MQSESQNEWDFIEVFLTAPVANGSERNLERLEAGLQFFGEPARRRFSLAFQWKAFDKQYEVSVPRALEGALTPVFDDRKPTSAADIAREVILGRSRNLSALLGDSHPHLPLGEVHASHLQTYKRLLESFRLVGITSVDQLLVSRIEQSAVVVGGPVASRQARLILGLDGYSPLLKARLPVHYIVTRSDYFGEKTTNRAKIVIDGAESIAHFILITSLPLGNEHRLVSISGLRAFDAIYIKSILSDERLVTRLHAAIAHKPGWQAVFSINVNSDGIPIGVEDFKVFELRNIDFERLPEQVGAAFTDTDSPKENELDPMLSHLKYYDMDQGISPYKSLRTMDTRRPVKETPLLDLPRAQSGSLSDADLGLVEDITGDQTEMDADPLLSPFQARQIEKLKTMSPERLREIARKVNLPIIQPK